ncbi:MAG: hypothetical protein RRA35_10085 [Desulfomonilia bacterium]|nr:hypothetical protein [Desulfomonilia bacterium]
MPAGIMFQEKGMPISTSMVLKITRLLCQWHHIPHLEPGAHTIRVSLNTNDHRVYTVAGRPVESEAYVVAK